MEKTTGIVGGVLPTYEQELTDVQERTIKNVISLLDKNEVSEELTRARVLARHKAFVRDVFNSGVEADIIQ